MDRLAAPKVEPVRRQIADVRGQVDQRLAGERAHVEELERQLQAELKRLTAGLAPGIQLPKGRTVVYAE